MAAASLSTSYTSSTPTSMAGPFMTAFTPPDHCGTVIKTDCYLSTPYTYVSMGSSSTYSYLEPVSDCSYVERDLTCGSDGLATRDSACFPNNDGGGSTGALIFSPGTGCPGGWETLSKVEYSSQTTAVCCPSGYRAHSTQVSCISSITYTDDATVVMSCSSGGGMVSDTITPSTYTVSGSTYTSTSVATRYSVVWAQRMLVVYPTASVSDVIVTPLDKPTASPGGSSPQTIPQNKDGSGLGTGAIVGIVVGVVGALLLVGAFFFWRRHQQKHRHAPVPKGSPAGEHDALPEFVATNGMRTGPAQMATSTSNGLFQPQPELRSPR